jgi:predicted nuclease of restriction endonuclease-like (RecB) superfamily
MTLITQEAVAQKNYALTLEQIKSDIQQSQLRAALSVTKELNMLYWRIGKMLSDKTSQEKWGAKTLEKLSKDIISAFPDISGFSFRNLKYMRQFAEAYPNDNWATAVAQIPWGHNVIIMDKVKNQAERLWYAQKAIENGWSRAMLTTWIGSNLYNRESKAITNFKDTLPAPQSDLAEQLLKDPYNFAFLALDKKHREQELEQGLIDHIQNFLLELGQGFAFVGRQYRLEVGGEDIVIDLLFYHLKLRGYFVIDLKAEKFEPRDAGQMNFYLSAVDDLLRHESDNPTIGIIICQSKNSIKAEYALRGIRKPIGISNYEVEIVKNLPKNLKASLPTIEEIEAELSKG